MAIKIAQINAQRSAAACMNLEMLMREGNIDILCIQEPYVFKGKVRGYTSFGVRVTQPDGVAPWVAVVSSEEKIQIFRLSFDKSDHVMCVHVKSKYEEFYLINVYCQFSLPIVPILQSIENILQRIKSANILITMDSNAKSHLWFSKDEDEREKIMEEFILHNNLFVLNEPNNVSTYMTTRGESNIDLTLISGKLLKAIKNWRVRKDCTVSDHNLITFEYDLLSEERRSFYTQDRYNIKKADWDKFVSLSEAQFNDDMIDDIANLEPERAVELFASALDSISKRSFPRKRSGKKLVPWWNSNLDKLRKASNSAKKQLLRARKLHLDRPEGYEATYKDAKNKYVREVKKSKKDTWQNFVITEGNKDPWSIVYKIAREKLRVTETACSLTLPTGEVTIGWRDTFEALMSKAVPEDSLRTETVEHWETKKENNNYSNSNMENCILEEEIEKVIRKLKNNKAPGLDGVHNETLKHLWKCKKEAILCLLNNCFRNVIFPRSWKNASITFILKDRNKDRTSISSYRPISLLPALGKVYERIIVDRLQLQYKEQKMESQRQCGFRKKRSTEDAFLYLRSDVENTKRKYVVILFIDIEGAFDNL